MPPAHGDCGFRTLNLTCTGTFFNGLQSVAGIVHDFALTDDHSKKDHGKLTSEKVPVSLFSKVDFPTDGKPTRPTLASPTLLTSNPACAANPQCERACMEQHGSPAGMMLLGASWELRGRGQASTFALAAPTTTSAWLQELSSQLRQFGLQHADSAHSASAGSPCNGATSLLCSLQALQPEQAKHQQACPRGHAHLQHAQMASCGLIFLSPSHLQTC